MSQVLTGNKSCFSKHLKGGKMEEWNNEILFPVWPTAVTWQWDQWTLFKIILELPWGIKIIKMEEQS